MSGINSLENKLSIVIVTYNRCAKLERTLNFLINSPIHNCRITVLNNCSTDETEEIIEKYKQKFSSLNIVTHPVNLGSGSANIVQSIHYCSTEYFWIMCDDDDYNFQDFDDVKDVISLGEAELIQVGAHNDGLWDWGEYATPKQLVEKGYNYFKYSSFTPCTIYKYSYFVKYMKEAYDFIHYRYPHFPCLVYAYQNDTPIYVSKKRIVTASIGVQPYSMYIPFRGFVMSSIFLKDNNSKRILFRSLYERKISLIRWFLSSPFQYENEYEINTIRDIIYNTMNWTEKIIVILLFFPSKVYYKIKHD